MVYGARGLTVSENLQARGLVYGQGIFRARAILGPWDFQGQRTYQGPMPLQGQRVSGPENIKDQRYFRARGLIGPED